VRDFKRRDGLGRQHDTGELSIAICQGHGVNLLGRMRVAIRAHPGRSGTRRFMIGGEMGRCTVEVSVQWRVKKPAL
jgi:hypothetical protein